MRFENEKCNLLTAFNYCSERTIETLLRVKKDVRFLLDSGAFSAFSQGKEVKLDDYERFVKSLQDKGVDVWRYFTLDVIGDPAQTRRNYDTLLSRGLTPIPIFTRGESLSSLDKYYETSDVVAIGGLVGTNDPTGFVNGVMAHVQDRRVHWLGFTRTEYLKHYRPYMCDCSTFSITQRYGRLILYAGNGHWLPQVSRESFLTSNISPQLCRALDQYGVRPSELAKVSAWRCAGTANMLCRQSWVRWMIDLHAKLGVHLFFSLGSKYDIELTLRHFKHWKQQACLVS